MAIVALCVQTAPGHIQRPFACGHGTHTPRGLQTRILPDLQTRILQKPDKLNVHQAVIIGKEQMIRYENGSWGGGHLYIFLYGDVPLSRVSFSGLRLRDRVSFLSKFSLRQGPYGLMIRYGMVIFCLQKVVVGHLHSMNMI